MSTIGGLSSAMTYCRWQTIRDEKGNANNDKDASLHLQLQDFATEELIGLNVLDDPISILAIGLCAYLDEAEQNVAIQNQGATRTAKSWVRMRRRQRTPPEELDDERETKFQKSEEKVMSKEERDDSSYKPSDGE